MLLNKIYAIMVTNSTKSTTNIVENISIRAFLL